MIRMFLASDEFGRAERGGSLSPVAPFRPTRVSGTANDPQLPNAAREQRIAGATFASKWCAGPGWSARAVEESAAQNTLAISLAPAAPCALSIRVFITANRRATVLWRIATGLRS
jgi:putative hemolysin